MFTGIIEQVGRVKTISANRLEIAADFANIEIGESIAVNGICLTVVSYKNGSLGFDYSPRTNTLTNMSEQKAGAAVNLERAVKLGARMGGHIVTGHIDCAAPIKAIQKEGDFCKITIAMPAAIARYIVPRGSAAVDGISLTVGNVGGDNFEISIIPQTLRATTLADARPGQLVNIECDILAKYTERLLRLPAQPQSKLSEDFLKENGF